MGNAPSSVTNKAKAMEIRTIDMPPTGPINRPPEAVQLDFDNMPFLQPPQESRPASGSYTAPGTPLPPATSPPLIGSLDADDEPFGCQATFVHSHTPRMPSEGHLDHTLNDIDFFGVSTAAVQDTSASKDTHNAGLHRSRSSITSQLSLLSQRQSPNGSPSSSPRSHRRSVMERFPSGQYEMIDAGVPPPVPPHFKFPDHISPKYNTETETALAAVDALEEDMELHCEPKPLRSRSRSLSRSLTRRKSTSAESMTSNKSMTTEIYTRKCSSPTLKSPESPSSLATSKSSETEDSVEEPESPGYDEDTSFSLEGYSEGTTKLRVVNFDNNGSYIGEKLEEITSNSDQTPQKQFVKSKAQLAEEKEQRIKSLQKRYERYGHKYHGKEVI